MYHPTSRVLVVLEILQSKPSVSGPELAEVLEVDVRTVRRYVTMLQDIGIPVEANIGRYGGYQLRPGFKLPPLMFNEDEATAIMLGLMGMSRRELGVSAMAVEAALGKMLRVLPVEVRERLQTVASNLVIFPGFQQNQFDANLLLNLSAAISQQQRLEIAYSSSGEVVTRRKIEPYGLVEWQNYWYVVGYCCLRQDYRTFRLDRMQKAQVLTETFERDPTFECQAYVTEHAIATARWQVKVEFLAPPSPDQQKRLSLYGTLKETTDGVVFEGPSDDLDGLARYLVSLGVQLVVQEPAELREAMLRLAEAITQMATAPAQPV